MAHTPYSYRNDDNVPEFPDDKLVFVFDGHCVLCSGMANIILKHDRDKSIRLLAAQSQLGEALYSHYDLKPDDYSTNIILDKGVPRTKMDGSLALFSVLGWPWKAINIIRIFPRWFQNRLYDVIARNRLKWFGQRDVCYLPRPEDKERFL